MSSETGRRDAWLRRLATLVVACYPTRFGHDFGDEMRQHIVERGRAARARGVTALVAFLIHLVADTARGVSAAFLDERRLRRRERVRRRSLLALRELGSSVLSDVRFALRAMKRLDTASLAAVLTLALGIGANTAMFSVVRGVILKPLDFPEAERIVQLSPGSVFSAEQVDALAESSSFRSLTALGVEALVFRSQSDARELRALAVDAGHFETFGVRPAIGRALRDSDMAPGAEPVALLGHGFWRRELGGDLAVIGETLQLSGAGAGERTIIGILPARYQVVDWAPAVLIPHGLEPGSHDYVDNLRFWAVGRLADGKGPQSAAQELRHLAGRYAAAGEKNFDREAAASLEVETYREARVGDVGAQLWAPVRSGHRGALDLVRQPLPISCWARSSARIGELSVRRALGADRRRVFRQLLTESLVLGFLGAVSGILVAWLAMPLLVGALPESLPRLNEIRLDGLVLAFALVTAVVAAAVSGLAPALRMAQPATTWGKVVGQPGGRPLSLSRLLVAAQIGMSVVLVSCCGLLVRSLDGLQDVQAGFDSDGLYALGLTPPLDSYPEEDDLRRYYRDVVEAVSAQPAIAAAGSISSLPLTRSRLGVAISPDGAPVPEREPPFYVSYRVVSPGNLSCHGDTAAGGPRSQR